MLPAENGTTRRTSCSGYFAASAEGVWAWAIEQAGASAAKAMQRLWRRRMVVLPVALPFRVGAILSQVRGTTTADIYDTACIEVCVGSDSEGREFVALQRSSPRCRARPW